MITFDVRRYNSIDSTNDQALRLACQGAPHGTVVCAREQTAGRGRQAKHWYSPRGNLYVSIMLRLHLAPDRIAPVGFVAALAVADAADAFLPNDVRTELKWPNDVLIRGAKVSGILIEFTQAATVVGIGMNVRYAPSETTYPATTLAVHGTGTPQTEAVLQTLLTSFSHRFDKWQTDGFSDVRSDWLARAHLPGTSIRLTSGNRSTEGRFVDLASDGALIVETGDGLVRFVAGEVWLG